MYEQSLYTILKDYVKPKVLDRNNRYKKWEYGYNKEHDFIVISKTGQVGEIYDIQGLKIGLPKKTNIKTFSNNKWHLIVSKDIITKVVFRQDAVPLIWTYLFQSW